MRGYTVEDMFYQTTRFHVVEFLRVVSVDKPNEEK